MITTPRDIQIKARRGFYAQLDDDTVAGMIRAWAEEGGLDNVEVKVTTVRSPVAFIVFDAEESRVEVPHNGTVTVFDDGSFIVEENSVFV